MRSTAYIRTQKPQGYKNGQVTAEAYQQDQVDLDTAEAQLQSDEAEAQNPSSKTVL